MCVRVEQIRLPPVSSDQREQRLLYPLQSIIPEIEIKTAARVAALVFGSKLARVDRPTVWRRSSVALPLSGSGVTAVGRRGLHRWHGSVEKLAAPDLPGFGNTVTPPRGEFT